jgi:hypothetical protein
MQRLILLLEGPKSHLPLTQHVLSCLELLEKCLIGPTLLVPLLSGIPQLGLDVSHDQLLLL